MSGNPIHEKATSARNSAHDEIPLDRHGSHAVVTAAYDNNTGETAVGYSGRISSKNSVQHNGIDLGFCAESHAIRQLLNHKTTPSKLEHVRFTKAMRNGQEVGICTNCMQVFQEGRFPEKANLWGPEMKKRIASNSANTTENTNRPRSVSPPITSRSERKE